MEKEVCKKVYEVIMGDEKNSFDTVSDAIDIFENQRSQYFYEFENGKNIQCEVILNELIDGNLCKIDEYTYEIYKKEKEQEQITEQQLKELIGQEWDYDDVICAFYTEQEDIIVEKSSNDGYDYIAHINNSCAMQYLFTVDENGIITDVDTYRN